jgi:putative sigma-54 modulation protein
MHLNIRGRKVPISVALRQHCMERLERALRPFHEHVRSAELVFTDFNGPRGGIGQACSVFVSMVGGTKLIVQSTESDFYAASSHAAARVGQLVRRQLTKGRTRLRTTPRELPSEAPPSLH